MEYLNRYGLDEVVHSKETDVLGAKALWASGGRHIFEFAGILARMFAGILSLMPAIGVSEKYIKY